MKLRRVPGSAPAFTWPRRRQILLLALVAGFVAVVGATHVFESIPLVRVKVVQQPFAATSGVADVTTVGLTDLSRLVPPIAVILRVTTNAGPAPFVVNVDGNVACRLTIQRGERRRADCAVIGQWSPTDSHTIRVEGPATPWTLDYLELATHHGNTSGTNYFVVLPGEADRYVRPATAVVVMIWAVCFLGGLLSQSLALPRLLRRAHHVAASAVLLLLLLAQFSQTVSNFRVVISFGTFLIWIAVLVSPAIWRLILWIARPAAASDARWTILGRAVSVGLIVFAVFDAVVTSRVRDSYGGNYSGLLLIARRVFDDNPLFKSRPDVRQTLIFDEGRGYDAQFFYYSAFDPFLRAFRSEPALYRNVVDTPPYRFGRIGYSLLTVVFSGDQWQRFPTTMVGLLLCSVGALGLLLAYVAQLNGLTAAVGAVVILIPGFWPSLQSALPEPLAAAGLVGGIVCLRRRSWLIAWGCFSLSLLVRETGVIAIIAAIVAATSNKDRFVVLSVGVGASLVVLLWRSYVASVLFPVWGAEAILVSPPMLGGPFAGFVDLWRAISNGSYYPGIPEMSRAGTTFPVLVICGAALALLIAASTRNPFGAAAVIYGLGAISLNYQYVWVHVGSGQRTSYELFLMLALCLLAYQQYSRTVRFALISFWCLAGLYTFGFTYDASYIRAALLMPV